jgi:hypothetical protein
VTKRPPSTDSPSHKGKFDVRSFYKTLACKEAIHFPWKSIWRTKVPLKVAFFAWTAAQGKILTLDNLRKKRVIVIDRCCMCKMNGESVDHLLLHCEVARVLWNAIFSRFSLSWIMPLRVVDLFACWWTGGRSRSVVVWKMVPCCLMWCLWRERNDRQFEDKEITIEDLISFFFHSLYSWSAAFLAPLTFSFNDFLMLFSTSSYMPFLYTSCVLDCALRFLMIFILLIKKKKRSYNNLHRILLIFETPKISFFPNAPENANRHHLQTAALLGLPDFHQQANKSITLLGITQDIPNRVKT